MPRTARSIVAGGYYHLINRGNDKAAVFRQAGDYLEFLRLIGAAQQRIQLTLLAACLMPNHFHLVASTTGARDISRWMQWLLTTHSHRHHIRYGTSGRVWQGRFKAFPIEQDRHLLTVMRYVERNALRAGLVEKAEDWSWNSLSWRVGKSPGPRLSPPPVKLPRDWPTIVNSPQTPAELEVLRACVNRQRPYGNERWVQETTARLGLESSVRPHGRPRRPGCQFPDRGYRPGSRRRAEPKKENVP
jgi:putative transposase